MSKYHFFDVPADPEKLAKNMSYDNADTPFFILSRPGCQKVVLTDENLDRYMHNGYTVECCYYEGRKYRNAFWVDRTYSWDLIPARR